MKVDGLNNHALDERVLLLTFFLVWTAGDLKRLSITELGFVTQGCLAKHVEKPGPVYLGNLALKINVKVGNSQRL